MKPNTDAKYIGIEIECIVPKDEIVVKNILRKYRLQNNVEVSFDGSIATKMEDNVERTCPDCNSSGEIYIEDEDINCTCYLCDGTGTISDEPGYEFKLLAKQIELKSVLTRMQLALNEMGAYVNESCGLHVHLDMRNRNAVACTRKLLNVQGIMMRSVPSSRRHNDYCLPVKVTQKTNLLTIGKYHAIHTEEALREHTTVEVRVHEGTVDCNAIHSWVKFLITTIDTDVATKVIRTTKKFPIRIQKYLEKRIVENL